MPGLDVGTRDIAVNKTEQSASQKHPVFGRPYSWNSSYS